MHFAATLASALLVGLAGHPYPAVLFALVLFMCLPALVGQPWVGWRLAWADGCWTLDRGMGPEPVQLCRESRAGPGGVYLRVRDMRGARHRLWVLGDAVCSNELRKLRVRLLLERGVERR